MHPHEPGPRPVEEHARVEETTRLVGLAVVGVLRRRRIGSQEEIGVADAAADRDVEDGEEQVVRGHVDLEDLIRPRLPREIREGNAALEDRRRRTDRDAERRRPFFRSAGRDA